MTQAARIMPATRNRNSEALRLKMDRLRLERRGLERATDGEKANPIGEARGSCCWCGGRALSRAGHPLGKDGLPVCLAVKRGFQW